MEQQSYTLVTHNLRFHADDIFACAVLSLIIKKEGKTYTVQRTRDPELIAQADFVFDVGGIYDPEKKRFDHHQKGGAGARPNGAVYASCGLVWKTYGDVLTGDSKLTQKIDEKLFQPIDVEDNGVATYTQLGEIAPYTLQSMLYTFRSTWKEDDLIMDQKFLELVALAEKIIEREIIWARDVEEAAGIVLETYNRMEDKRLVIFDVGVPAEEVLMNYPEPLFIIKPNTDGGWRLIGISAKPHSFERRKNMPASWGGLMNADLEKVTGVPGATFCHNGLWLAIAKNKEAILALAKIALEA